MAPTVGRIAFTMGVLLVTLALIPLPFLPRDSAEFVIDLIAVALSSLFLALVVWDVRRQARLPGGRPRTKPPDSGTGEEDCKC